MHFEPVDKLDRRGGDQIGEMDHKLHPDLKEPLTRLCSDPKTTIVVLSGSDRSVSDENFGEYNMRLAAENGMFLGSTKGDWMTTIPEHSNMKWVDCVKDEDIYTVFEPELPLDIIGMPRPKLSDATKPSGDKRPGKSGSKSSQKQTDRQCQENKLNGSSYNNNVVGNGGRQTSPSPDKITWNVLDLKGDNFSPVRLGRPAQTHSSYSRHPMMWSRF